MATTETVINVPPHRVFGTLCRAEAYGDWVVGSRSIRDVDVGFPDVGTRFHHTVGWGPLHVADHTEVLAVDEPTLLVLRAKTRPFGSARVALELHDLEDGRTRVVMHEGPGDLLSRLAFNPLVDRLLHHRNVEGLRRLKRICEDGDVRP